MLDPLDRILAIADATPDALAVHTDDASWSYRDFMQRAWSYAAVFAKTKAACVAVCLPQENHAYAAFVGAGLAGGYHSPLNTAAPDAKLSRIIAKLQPDFIVARSPLANVLVKAAPDAVLVDPDQLDLTREAVVAPQRHEYAYVNFTSGSTGEPKGVIVSRKALACYVDWLATFGITARDRVSQQPNLAFDISQTDIYAALCFGAALYPVLAEQDKMMPGHFVRKHAITIWNSTPSAISQLMRGRQLTPDKFGTVRLVNFCGEALYPAQVEAVFNAAPDAIVQNTYGPTEATVAVTCARLARDSAFDSGQTTIALGDMLPMMDIQLIDGPSVDEGEAVIFGPQLAVGYWQDEAKTDEMFQDFDGRRGYRTGDWMIRKAGQLYFRERIDFQVRIRGYRIELDEVAAAIRKAGWNVAVVFSHKDGLAAVVEHEQGKEFNPRYLKSSLEAYIEKHAIPAKIVAVDHIPRNDNDKLDRKAAQQLFLDSLSAS